MLASNVGRRLGSATRSCTRKKFGGASLAVVEYVLHLALHEEAVSQIAKWTKGKFVFDMIAQHCAFEGSTELRLKAVAVFPVSKWPTMLYVTKVAVPFEFGDFGVPGNAKGRVRKGQEGDGHAAASTCRVMALRRRRWSYGTPGRSCNTGGIDTRLLPLRHKSREVFRIGKEVEDGFDRVGQPLFGGVGVSHKVSSQGTGRGISDVPCAY